MSLSLSLCCPPPPDLCQSNRPFVKSPAQAEFLPGRLWVQSWLLPAPLMGLGDPSSQAWHHDCPPTLHFPTEVGSSAVVLPETLEQLVQGAKASCGVRSVGVQLPNGSRACDTLCSRVGWGPGLRVTSQAPSGRPLPCVPNRFPRSYLAIIHGTTLGSRSSRRTSPHREARLWKVRRPGSAHASSAWAPPFSCLFLWTTTHFTTVCRHPAWRNSLPIHQ